MIKPILKIIHLLLIALPGSAICQTCPVITQKITTEGNRSDAPEGFFVYGIYGHNGIFLSKIRDYSPVVLPDTKNDAPMDISLSSNGKWVLYNANGTPFLVRLFPNCKIKIPVSVDRALNVCFWRNQPNGQEAICYMSDFSTVRAVSVKFDKDTVSFSNDRLIVSLGDSLWIRPNLRFCISSNQLFSALHPLYQGGHSSWWTVYLTLPNNGQSVATEANIYKWTDPFSHTGGCAHAMSWDGELCAADVGAMSMSQCLPREHKGFTITPFWKDTDEPQSMENSISKAISMNWCPERFRVGSATEQNFWDWYFGNSNDYVIGNQLGDLADIHGIWLVRWRDNNWTLLTDPNNKIEAFQPAVHFCNMDSVKVDTSQGNSEDPVFDPYDPNFKVVSPNGGEVFYLGDTIKLRLSSKKNINSAVKITIDGGLNWKYLINSSIDPYSDSIIPIILTLNILGVDSSNISDFSECMVMIEDYGTGRYSDYSDSFFTIKHSRPAVSDEEDRGGCGRGVSHALIPIFIIKLRRIYLNKKVKSSNRKQ